eukprot:TRINITY_DN6945_c1_g1_i1.p1 TRINITY_DN6945_c1_g1~~TRINITY_DN6945_c1_g1_i1.p1  ORF type:complete len:336 (+),score=58.70 TRINITY_DN6945_c1_g1_i1:44-1009(+)
MAEANPGAAAGGPESYLSVCLVGEVFVCQTDAQEETDTDDEVDIIMEAWKKGTSDATGGQDRTESKQVQISRQAAKARFLNYHNEKTSTKPYWKVKEKPPKATEGRVRVDITPLATCYARKGPLNAYDDLAEAYAREIKEANYKNPEDCFGRFLLRFYGVPDELAERVPTLQTAIDVIRKKFRLTQTQHLYIAIDDIAHLDLETPPRTTLTTDLMKALVEIQSPGKLTFVFASLSPTPPKYDAPTDSLYAHFLTYLAGVAEWCQAVTKLFKQSMVFRVAALRGEYCFLGGYESKIRKMGEGAVDVFDEDGVLVYKPQEEVE